MNIKKAAVTAAAAAALIGTPAAAEAAAPRAAVAIGEIHPLGYQGYCLSALVIRDGAAVTVAKCTNHKNQQWVIVRTPGRIGHIISVADQQFCLGVSTRGRMTNAVLQDCATEFGHGAIMYVYSPDDSSSYYIQLLNGLALSYPMAVSKVHTQSATWSDDRRRLYVWVLPRFKAVT